ncbi:fimbrial protein [Lysobacter sp. FW306-1B-D06B]|uniref:fimbrial protein n=1 Tax=Lysobacter sp. FW306-1B-D06B TaxID=3140250 RepID=UPI0031404653
MNKNLLSAAMVAALGFSVVGTAAAADGKITFKGDITDVTCTVTAGTGITGSNGNFAVAMGSVNKSALATLGARAADTPFSLVIGGSGQTGCTDGKVVKLRFEPAQSPVDMTTGRLTNAAGTAPVVQVGLLNKNKADINLADPTDAANIGETISANTATMNYWAQMYAPATGVGSGTVDTFVMYSLQYN